MPNCPLFRDAGFVRAPADKHTVDLTNLIRLQCRMHVDCQFAPYHELQEGVWGSGFVWPLAYTMQSTNPVTDLMEAVRIFLDVRSGERKSV